MADKEGSRGRAERLGRTPFGAAGPGSEEGGSDRGTSAICEAGEESACLDEERSHPLWSDPPNPSAAAAAQRGGAEETRSARMERNK